MFSIPSTRLRQSLKQARPNGDDHPIWDRFRRNVSISVLGSGFSLAVKLGQAALLTKVLKIEDYGRVLIAVNLFVFLDSFVGLRVNDVMFRFFLPFEEAKDRHALKGLILFCLGTCLVSGVLIYGGVLVLSPWLAELVYPGLEMEPLFRIYGCTALVTAFAGVYEPILRIHDRILSVIRPQVLGSLVTFVILCIYFRADLSSGFSSSGSYNIGAVVAAFAVGALVQSLPPFVQALRVVKPMLVVVKAREAFAALNAYRQELAGCFFNSNLSNYLKFATSPGDVFLLGIFSTPAQLALYGVAKQLTAPLGLLLLNLQTAISPEITTLAATKKFQQLQRLVVRSVWSMFVIGSLLMGAALLLGHFLLATWVKPEYFAALPVFYVLTVSAWLMLLFHVFRPVAVNLDLLKWHNLALLVSAGIVAVFIIFAGLNAMTMACLQLAEVLVLRAMVNGLVWTRLKRLATGV